MITLVWEHSRTKTYFFSSMGVARDNFYFYEYRKMVTHHFKFKVLYFQKINSTTKLDDLNTNCLPLFFAQTTFSGFQSSKIIWCLNGLRDHPSSTSEGNLGKFAPIWKFRFITLGSGNDVRADPFILREQKVKDFKKHVHDYSKENPK